MMRKTIILVLFVLSSVFTYGQTEGTYHILKAQKNRNTGKLLKSMYLQVKEHKQLGTVLVISTQKGAMGIPFTLDKVSTKKAKRQVFSYTQSFVVEYEGDSFIAFNVLGLSPDGKLKIGNPNYFAKDKAKLSSMTVAKIEDFAQKVYDLTK